jgi:protein associated with RNAse G/E
MDKNILNDSKFFEKQEIRWFSVEEMRTKKKQFRKFYQEMIDDILGDIRKITAFIKKTTPEKGALSKTRKEIKGG